MYKYFLYFLLVIQVEWSKNCLNNFLLFEESNCTIMCKVPSPTLYMFVHVKNSEDPMQMKSSEV